MKTIINIDRVLETDIDLQKNGISTFSVDQLTRTGNGTVLIPKNGRYLIVSNKPPQAVVSTESWGVFSSSDMHEPIASFLEETAALKWADDNGYSIVEKTASLSINTIKILVSILVLKSNDEILFLYKEDCWTLPTTELKFGESITMARTRIEKLLGTKFGQTLTSSKLPFANALIEDQQILYLVLAARVSDIQETATMKFFPAATPPENHSFTVATLISAVD